MWRGVEYVPASTDGLGRYERWLNSPTTVEEAQRDLFVERPIGQIPVVAHDDGPRDGVALGAVAGETARDRLRELADDQGRREGDDFVAVA